MNEVALVMPVHNALEYVQRSLGQIRETSPELPLILVDDASDAATHAYLEDYVLSSERHGQVVCLLTNPTQQLFTRTVNRGLRGAYHAWSPQYIGVINSDCDLQPDWCLALKQGFAQPGRVGIVGYSEGGPSGRPEYEAIRMPGYITGHCLLLKTQLLKEIGVFCETDTDGRNTPELAAFKGQAHIGSDRLLSWRANAAGWATYYCHRPLCGHAGGRSWNHDLGWLSRLQITPLWHASDTLSPCEWYGAGETVTPF